jgi:hypothetical protein
MFHETQSRGPCQTEVCAKRRTKRIKADFPCAYAALLVLGKLWKVSRRAQNRPVKLRLFMKGLNYNKNHRPTTIPLVSRWLFIVLIFMVESGATVL